MAKKKRYSNNNNNNKAKVEVNKSGKNLNKNVDSLVDELEKTQYVPSIERKKQEEKKIEQLESTMDLKEVKEQIKKEIEKEVEPIKEEIVEVEKAEVPKEDIKEVTETIEETVKEEVIEEKKEEVVEEEVAKKIVTTKEEVQEKREDDFLDDFDIKPKSEREAEKKQDLSKTNSYRFSFDDKRLSEQDSLDTSFLEGRIKNTPKGEKKKVKGNAQKKPFKPNITLPKITLPKREPKPKVFVPKTVTPHVHHTPSLFVRRLTCAIILIIVSFLLGFAICYRFAVKTQIQIEKVDVVKEVKVADDNYVFLGDSITDFYDLGKYYSGLPVINSGINGNNTKDVLDSLNDRVYRYNPSKVFILLGTNDYVSLRRNESIKDNITKIIEEIHKNRPLTKVYIESITPVTVVEDDCIHYDFIRARDNKEIEDANEILKKVCKDNNATFIDTYSLFYDDNEGLKLEYTRDGLHLNDNGYRVLTDEIMKYIKA